MHSRMVSNVAYGGLHNSCIVAFCSSYRIYTLSFEALVVYLDDDVKSIVAFVTY